MTSWIMELWMRNHDQSEWPELSIRQSDDACHVTDAKDHPPKEDIEKMCSEGFFLKHHYKYVDQSKLNVEEEDYHASCSSEGSLDEYESWDRGSGYHEPYSGRSLKRSGVSLASSKELTGYLCSSEKDDGKTGKSNVSEPHLPHLPNAKIDLQTPLKSNNEASEIEIDEIVEDFYEELPNESDYLEPEETKGDEVHENKHHLCNQIRTEALFYGSSDVSKCSRFLPTKQISRSYSTIPHSRAEGTNEALSSSNEKPSCHSYSGEIEEEYEEPSNISRQSLPKKMQSGNDKGTKHPSNDVKGTNAALSSSDPKPSCHSYSGEIEEEYEELPNISRQSLPKKMQSGNDKGTKHPCNDATFETLFYISTDISGCSRPHVITKEQSNNNTPNLRTRNEKRKEAQLASNEKPSCSSPTERMEKESDEESKHVPKRLLPVQRNGFGSNDTIFLSHTTSRDVCERQISQDTKRHTFSEVTNETLHYSSADVVQCKRPRNDIYQASHSFRTEKEDPYLQLNQEKSSLVEYQTLDFSRDRHSSLPPEDMAHLSEHQNSLEHNLDEDDSSLYDDVIGCISEDSTHLEQFVRDKTCLNEYQNNAYQSDEDETSSVYDDVIGFITDDSTRFQQFSNGDGGVAEYQNMAQKLEGNDCASYNKSLAITKGNTDSGGYQHTGSKLNQDDSAVYDKLRHGKDDSAHVGKFQSMTRGGLRYGGIAEYQNTAQKLSGTDCASYNKSLATTKDNTDLGGYQHTESKLNQDDSAVYDKLRHGKDDSATLGKFQSMTRGLRDGGVAGYQNMAQQLGGTDCASYNKSLAITKDNTDSGGYQHTAGKLNQDDSAVYDKLRHGKDDSAHVGKFQSMTRGLRDGGVAEYENTAQKLSGTDCASFNKSLAITKDNTDSGGYQHTASKLNQNDSAVYDKLRHGKDDSKPLGKFQSMTRGLRGDDRSMYKNPRSKTEDEAEYENTKNQVVSQNEKNTTHNFDLQSHDAEPFTYQNLEYMQTIPFRLSHKGGQTSTTQGTQAKTKKESHPRNKESVRKVSALHHAKQRDENVYANRHTKNGTRHSSIGGAYRHAKDRTTHSSIGGAYRRREGIRLDHGATSTAAKHDIRSQQRHHSTFSRAQLDDPNLNVIYF